MTDTNLSLHDVATAWIDGDPDESMRAQLQAILDSGDEPELLERMGASLAFGTAGLRGLVGAGSNRMNRAVVIRATRGLADHLLERVSGAAERGVVVGFDARHDSLSFARDAVGVLAAAGIRVRWFPQPQPTPLVAFAQQDLDAAAAIVVTASHNPPDYNGYKVYLEGAAQIVPPADVQIAAAIDAVGPAKDVPLVDPDQHERVSTVDPELVERYLAALAAARPTADGDDITIAYTPLHGVGGHLVARALDDAGYRQVHVEPSQAEPDGDFPTVAFPNPEEPGAMDAVLALATDVEADLVLANDPDADRLAVAVPEPDGGYLALTGNQVGILMAEYLLARTDVPNPLVVSSIVSSPMLAQVAAAHGARAEVTLTGFKWIAAAARALEQDGHQFVFGFEEALGLTVGTVVRDKDGIGSAVVAADMARTLAAQQRTLHDQWETLSREHGLWVSHQLSVTRPGAAGQAQIAAAMERAGEFNADNLDGHRVLAATDYRTDATSRPPWLASTELVALDLDDGRVMIRPSGTEPKCKIYVDLRATLTDGERVAARTADVRRDATRIADAFARAVGLA